MNSSKPYKQVVGIFGAPRSGTSWIGQIFNSSPAVAFRFQPLFSYEFKDRLHDKSTPEEIDKFHEDLWHAKSDFVLQKENVSGNKGAEFQKFDPDTLVWKEVRYLHTIPNLLANSDMKLVFIVRHPAAVINSWLKAPKEFKPEWNAHKEWRQATKKNDGRKEEFNGYEKWKEAAQIFLDARSKFPERTILVRYKDLVGNPLEETKRIFKLMNLPLHEQTKQFLIDSTSRNDDDPYGVYRQDHDIENWRRELDPEIAAAIQEDFEASGLREQLGYS